MSAGLATGRFCAQVDLRQRPSSSVWIDSRQHDEAAAREAWVAALGDAAHFAESLQGAFAAVVWDAAAERLVLVRDRFGEKPLYWTRTPDGIAFASEIKMLRAAGMVPDASVSPEAVDAYLSFTYIPAPSTIHQKVQKVPAGHCIIFNVRAGVAVAPESLRYFTLPDRSRQRATPADMLERLSEGLRRRLPASGPIAAFLSGGLDSSLVVALLAREGFRRLPVFSAGFADERLDESEHALRIARLVEAEHHLIRLTDVDPDLVGRVIFHLDEPMADAACIPTWLLSQEASRAAPVIFTGDAADALLVGDHWFRRMHRLDHLERLPRLARALLPTRKLRHLAALADLPPAARYLRIRQKWTPAERAAIYAPDFRRRLDATAADASYLAAPVEWKRGGSVEAAVRLDSIHGLPEDLLMKSDKMASAHGVECRSPFLEAAFAHWAGRIPIHQLLVRGRGKHLLRKAAEAILPRDLIYRRKQGFQTPVARWLKGPLRALVEAAFEPVFVRQQGIFDPAALALLRKRFEDAAPSPALAGQVWQIVCLQTWWRQIF